MTDEQIEKAARKLCELHAIQPDTPTAPLGLPAWQVARDEVRKFWNLARAVHFAVEGEDLK